MSNINNFNRFYDNEAILPSWSFQSKFELPLTGFRLFWTRNFKGRQISNLFHMGSFCITRQHQLIINDFSDWIQSSIEGRVLAVNSNGEINTLFTINRPINPSIIGEKGNLYFSTAAEHDEDFYGHQLLCINQSGKLVFTRDLVGYPSALPFFDSEGNIIVFTTKPKTIVMNVLKSNGQQEITNLKADVDMPAILNSPSLSSDGSILIQISDGNVLFLKQGHIRWKKNLDALASSNHIIDQYGNCYIASGEKLFCFNNQGQLNWTNKAKFGYCGLALSRIGDIFATLQNGSMMCLDKNGIIKWVKDSLGYLSQPPIIDLKQNVCIIGKEDQTLIIRILNCYGQQIVKSIISSKINEHIVGYTLGKSIYLLSSGIIEKGYDYETRWTLYSIGNET